MSAVTANIIGVTIARGADANQAGDTAPARIATFNIFFNNGATQVAGGTDTLDVDVSTVLPLWVRNSQSYTLRSCSVIQIARTSGSTEYAATLGISSNTVQLTPKTIADWSTNATIAASALEGGVPYGISVTVSS